MICRICGSNNVQVVGKYKPYIDYECLIYDCDDCRCRFAPYDKSIYEKLHSTKGSTYLSHDEMANKVEAYFKKKNLDGLREFLSKTPKNKFVIDTIERDKNIKKILEIGCSKGYLTSYFILKKFDTTGADIAPTAVREANKRFGNYFFIFGDPAITDNAPYDVIYHVGTIGCVKSPIDLIKYLLSLLKPNGQLIFNAPNISACLEADRIWVAGTPPPDLVTLFKKEFWKDNFNDIADVTVHTEHNEAYQNALIYIKKFLGNSNDNIAKRKLFEDIEPINYQRKIFPFRTVVSKSFKRASSIFSCFGMIPKYTSEFGMYVVMKKK